MFDRYQIKFSYKTIFSYAIGILSSIILLTFLVNLNTPYDLLTYKKKVNTIKNKVVCSKTPLERVDINNIVYYKIDKNTYGLYDKTIVVDTIINNTKYIKYSF